MLDRRAVYSLARATAVLLWNGDTDFENAFEKTFPNSNFHPDDKGLAKVKVGEIMNYWREKKKMRNSHLEPKKMVSQPPVVKQASLGLHRSRYPD